MVLGAGCEQYADRIQQVKGWALCSSDLTCLSSINHPKEFFESLKKLDIFFPEVCFSDVPSTNDWLFKRSSTCGGIGISREKPSNQKGTGGYWQRELKGQSLSVLCISDGQDHKIIGINQQFSHSCFEGLPYLYEGALANALISEKNRIKISSYIEKFISCFNIIGVFSMDMIVDENNVFVLEINPRISASYELYERLNPGLNLVDAHIRVCEGERLSNIQISNLNVSHCGYLIIFAESNLVVPMSINWPSWVKDRPESNRRISVGNPVCSVYVESKENANQICNHLEKKREQILNYLKQ